MNFKIYKEKPETSHVKLTPNQKIILDSLGTSWNKFIKNSYKNPNGLERYRDAINCLQNRIGDKIFDNI